MHEDLSEVPILLVDDEPAIPRILKEGLAARGYTSEIASDGLQAVKMLTERPFLAIVSDLNMPAMSGLDLLREVKDRKLSVAFVIATGESDIHSGIAAMKQGADDYLVKPLAIDVVACSIERALDRKRLEREVEEYRKNLEDMVQQRTKQLQSAMKRIELTYDETLEALGAALDLRDNETAGHSQRVTRYCLELARKAGVRDDELKHLERGAYLHDVGKIGISDSILLKPGKLTPEESAIMQTHARIGYDLVSRVAFLARSAEIVLTHQERFDGTGYPQGLLGMEIPLGSRIFAVADTLDAMTSDRPYRKALSFEAAREEVKRESASQFDPEVVGAFLSISDSQWMEVRKGAISNVSNVKFRHFDVPSPSAGHSDYRKKDIA